MRLFPVCSIIDKKKMINYINSNPIIIHYSGSEWVANLQTSDLLDMYSFIYQPSCNAKGFLH